MHFHRQKAPQCRRLSAPYHQAFERLDKALAENTPSNDIEKIDKIRRLLFGAENVEAADRSAEAAQKTREESGR